MHRSTRRSFESAVLFGVLSLAGPVCAEVRDSAPNGFTVASAAAVSASPTVVYDSIVKDIGAWWNPEHTYSGNSANLSIEPRSGGCFCEKLGTGFVRHLDVVYADPGKVLRMVGGLGPLQSMAAAGVLTFAMQPDSSGATRVSMTYTVGGYQPGGFESLAPIVDSVLAEQFARLTKYANEKGAVVPPRAAAGK